MFKSVYTHCTAGRSYHWGLGAKASPLIGLVPPANYWEIKNIDNYEIKDIFSLLEIVFLFYYILGFDRSEKIV